MSDLQIFTLEIETDDDASFDIRRTMDYLVESLHPTDAAFRVRLSDASSRDVIYQSRSSA